MPVQVFLSFAHEDEGLMLAVVTHLTALEREGLIEVWHRGMLSPGDVTGSETTFRFEASELVLVLLSPDYIASDQCMAEGQASLKLEAKVVPVVLRPCSWMRTSLGGLEPLPRGGRAVSSWEDPDVALQEIVEGVRRVARGEPLTGVLKRALGRLGLIPAEPSETRFREALRDLDPRNPVSIRVGAVHALDRLVQDDPDRYREAVPETLCSYVRENAESVLRDDGQGKSARPREEIQLILKLLGKERDSDLDFRRSDLRGVSLVRSDLRRCNFYRADLAFADLRGADFTDAYLRRADLKGVYGEKSLDGGHSSGVVVSAGAQEFNQWSLDELDLPKVDFDDLVSVWRVQGVVFRGANLQGANLQGAKLPEVDLRDADLHGANLQEADLRLARLNLANLQQADLQRVNLRDALLRETTLQNANLGEADLRDADLRGANLEGADLRHANLQRTNLQGANLQGTRLEGTGFEGANLREVALRGLELKGAYLQGANLLGANLQGEDLQDLGLQGVNLQGADLRGASLQRTNLTGADLRDAALHGTDFRDAVLRWSRLDAVDLLEVRNLTQEQLGSAHGNRETRFPEGLIFPSSWPDYFP